MEAVHILKRLSPHVAGSLTVELLTLNLTTSLCIYHCTKSYGLMLYLLVTRYIFMKLQLGIKLPRER